MLRCVSAALFSVFLTSCTSTSDPITQFGLTPLAVPNATADASSRPPRTWKPRRPIAASTRRVRAARGRGLCAGGEPRHLRRCNRNCRIIRSIAQRAALATTFPKLRGTQPLDDGASRSGRRTSPRCGRSRSDTGRPGRTGGRRLGCAGRAATAAGRPAVVQQKRRGFLSSFFSQSAPSAPPRVVEPRRKPLVQLASVGTQPTTPTAKIGRAANGETLPAAPPPAPA